MSLTRFCLNPPIFPYMIVSIHYNTGTHSLILGLQQKTLVMYIPKARRFFVCYSQRDC